MKNVKQRKRPFDVDFDVVIHCLVLKIEPYLLKVPPRFYLHFAKLRTGNHRFPCERGRWLGLEINDRECNLCDLHEVGDVFHYVLICPFFKNERQKYINKYYYTSTNVLKFKELLNSENELQLRNICIFAKMLIQRVQWSFTLKIIFMLFQNKFTLSVYCFIIIMFLFSFSSFHSYVMCMTWVCLNKEYCIVLYCTLTAFCCSLN